MIFWIIAAALTLAAVAALARPLLRRSVEAGDAAEFDLEVYRDQLAEIERDRTRGVLTDNELEAARAEIARRMLAADARRSKKADRAGARDRPGLIVARTLSALLAVAVPVCAVLLYLQLGQPSAPDMPLALRTDLVPDGVGQMEQRQAIAGLQRRVEENPADAEAWQRLGMALKSARRFDESVTALRRAIGLTPATPVLNAEYGEALVMAAQGTVTPEAHAAFEAVLQVDSGDPRAHYYLATANYQAGRTREALDGWAALIADSPADAPWLDLVRRNLAQAAEDLGLDVASVTPESRPADQPAGPAVLTPEQREAMAAMTPEERQAMIRDMVDGLAARLEDDPMDLEGWLRLIRARSVLGEQAQAALDRALEVFADAPFPKQRLTALAGELGLAAPDAGPAGDAPDIGAMVARLAERLKREPDDLEGWVMLARSYTVLGRSQEAREAIAKAAALAPDDTEILTLHARAIRDAEGADTTESIELMRRVLKIDPTQPEALWFLAHAETEAGNTQQARALLETLYAQIPEDNPDRAVVRERIDALAGG